MSQKLPLQVRLHVRDIIDAPEGEVSQALKSLNTLTGYNLSLEIAWEDIHRDLKKSFADDIEKLVPSISRHITIFLTRLEALLEQDEAFQDVFLERFKSLASILAVVVQDGSKTSCKIVNHRVTLQLPTTGNEGFKLAQTSIGSDLVRVFKDDDEHEEDARPAAIDNIEEDQDWDTVNIVPAKAEISSSSKQHLGTHAHKSSPLKFEDSASTKPRPLPKLQSLQRPEVLFEDTLPAFLSIKGHDRELHIEGSHAPTITLIAEYFKKYARKDMSHTDQAPRFKVELLTSNFGSGTMSDYVHIELWNHNREWRINVAMFLAFVEGICAYEMVEIKSGSYLYKRTVPF